jgi:transposase
MATKGRRQKKADGPLVAALAGGLSVRAAAKKAGLAERTAYRRLDDPNFRRDVDQARREIITRATAKLAASSTKAADTLRRLLGSKDERVRLSAARWTLRLLTHMLDHEELSDRVAALENKLDGARTR